MYCSTEDKANFLLYECNEIDSESYMTPEQEFVDHLNICNLQKFI